MEKQVATPPTFFPQNLANFRGSKRLRSNQACELLQLSRAALKAYEKGECMPTPEMLCKLARIMGVSVAGLIGQRIIFNEAEPV